MIEIFLFIWNLIMTFGSKNCRSYLIHTLSWQKGHTLQALMMSFTILQNIICWKRKVSFFHVEPTFSSISKLQGTHAYGGNTGYMMEDYLEWAKAAGTAWYRSQEPVPVNHPFVGGGYLSNKKWPLIEESNVLVGNSNSGLV